MLALRFDVDTRGGLDRAGQLLDLLDRHRLRATFFVVMGREATIPEIVRLRLLAPADSKSPLNVAAKGGAAAVIKAAVLPRRVGTGRPDALRDIVRRGHELQPHGWSHIQWQRGLAGIDPADHLRRARAALVPVLGELPDGWASPGRSIDARGLAAMDAAGLRYAGDLPGDEPFVPAGRSTWQLPISHFETIAQMRARGLSDDEVLDTWLTVIHDRPEYCCLYEHPDDLTAREIALFGRLMAALDSGGREVLTLGEVARRVG